VGAIILEEFYVFLILFLPGKNQFISLHPLKGKERMEGF